LSGVVRLVLHPEAHTELQAAAVWYDEQRLGLGDEFVADANATFSRLAATPQHFPTWPGLHEAEPPVCRALLSKFPYVVACEVHDEYVLVLAITHVRRRPLYWLTRSAT
jgi:toxin ParE1/3/4